MKSFVSSFFVTMTVVSLALSSANAANFYVSSGEVKTGEWNDNIEEVLDKGAAENVPVVIIGTAFGCGFCDSFKNSILSSQQFKDWVASSPYYFCYAYSGSGWWTTKPLKRVIDIVGNGSLPRVEAYWVKEDGTVVGGQSKTIVGRSGGVQTYKKIITSVVC